MGNEVADRLAKRGADMAWMGPEPGIPIPAGELSKLIRKWCHEEHSQEWRERSDCRQTKLFMPTPNAGKNKKFLKQTTNQAHTLIGLMTGHNNLQYHRYKMNLEEDPTCQMCLEAEHFLTSCPAFGKLCWETFRSIALKSEDLPTLGIKKIMSFVKHAERF